MCHDQVWEMKSCPGNSKLLILSLPLFFLVSSVSHILCFSDNLLEFLEFSKLLQSSRSSVVEEVLSPSLSLSLILIFIFLLSHFFLFLFFWDLKLSFSKSIEITGKTVWGFQMDETEIFGHITNFMADVHPSNWFGQFSFYFSFFFSLFTLSFSFTKKCFSRSLYGNSLETRLYIWLFSSSFFFPLPLPLSLSRLLFRTIWMCVQFTVFVRCYFIFPLPPSFMLLFLPILFLFESLWDPKKRSIFGLHVSKGKGKRIVGIKKEKRNESESDKEERK